MEPQFYFQLFLLVLTVYIIKQAIFICTDNERLAISLLGKMKALRGPGLVMIIPFTEKAIKVKIGDSGKVVADDMIKIKDVIVPISPVSKELLNKSVRISAFKGSGEHSLAVVQENAETRRTIKCEKCGHENKIY